jgi:hypothetical protein
VFNRLAPLRDVEGIRAILAAKLLIDEDRSHHLPAELAPNVHAFVSLVLVAGRKTLPDFNPKYKPSSLTNLSFLPCSQ